MFVLTPRFPSVVNSIWAILWDMIMDWGVLCVHQEGITQRRDYKFFGGMSGKPSAVSLAIFVNIVLRFSWLSRVFRNSIPEPTRMCMLEFLEVFRRAVWFVLRYVRAFFGRPCRNSGELNYAWIGSNGKYFRRI